MLFNSSWVVPQYRSYIGETYQNAEKVPSQYWNTNEEVTQETVDAIENILIEAGYSVINSDIIYPEYLENSDCFKPFWEHVKQKN